MQSRPPEKEMDRPAPATKLCHSCLPVISSDDHDRPVMLWLSLATRRWWLYTFNNVSSEMSSFFLYSITGIDSITIFYGNSIGTGRQKHMNCFCNSCDFAESQNHIQTICPSKMTRSLGIFFYPVLFSQTLSDIFHFCKCSGCLSNELSLIGTWLYDQFDVFKV